MENIFLKINECVQEKISKIRKEEEDFLKKAMLINCIPPLKGEVTKGKIKWRGIYLCRQKIGFDNYSWLEQRGKKISEKFKISL